MIIRIFNTNSKQFIYNKTANMASKNILTLF